MDLATLLADPDTRIIVCCGAGGVGKTTTSAALALAAAEAGRTVVVLTIDPARRLAQSLGLEELDNEPRRVDVPGADGELHAMMLDMKRTFDDVVVAHSTPERAEQILAEPLLPVAVVAPSPGTQEYMAMEKLGQLRASDQWDLIIVDTPPSRSALDFLDAPNKMSRFLDGTMIRLLTAPARAGGRAGLQVRQRRVPVLQPDHQQDPGRPAAARHLRLRRGAGHDVRRLPGAGDGHLRAAAAAGHVVRRRRHPGARRAARGLLLRRPALRRGHAAGRPGAQPHAPAGDDGAVGDPRRGGGRGGRRGRRRRAPSWPRRALRVHAERMVRATREQHLADRFTSAHPEVAVRTVPAAAGDVHDLDGLRIMGAELTGRDADTPTGTPRTRILPARRG